MSFTTPVGFIIFNRPDLTEQTFQAIAKAKPKTLLVAADGPRSNRPGEAEKCEQTRAVIQKVDWDCEVLTDFSEVNLGCGRRESSAFDWIFSQVEEAILLEDDTFPSPSFFSFCETMLERYRHDERIMHINGDNSANQGRTQDSYYFSKYVHGWGWASWRRAWKHYDYQMKTWPDFRDEKLLQSLCEAQFEQKYWTEVFNQMYEDPQVIDTWYYQWLYACWSQNGLAITPNQNLISNIGFNRPDAAHTVGDSPRSKLAIEDLWEISHPPFVTRNWEADNHTLDKVFNGKKLRQMDTLPGRLRQRLSSVKRKLTPSTK